MNSDLSFFRARIATVVLLVLTVFVSGCDLASGGSAPAGGPPQSDEEKRQAEASGLSLTEVPDEIEMAEVPETGVSLGWAWDKANHEPIPTICVEFVEGEEKAQTRYLTMSEVSDTYELMQSMDISAEASVKTIGFKAEGKAAFAKSVNINSSSNTFVMNAKVFNGVRFAAPAPLAENGEIDDFKVTYRGGLSGSIRLTERAVQLASKRELTDFKSMCGTAFVSAIFGGAKLTAVITTNTSSRSEKESMSAELSGSGWGAEFSSKLDSDTQVNNATDSMNVSLFQTGGSGDAIPVTKEDLVKKMETLSMDAYTAPKDFSIALTPYELLSNWPKRALPSRATELDELASFWGAYNTLYDEIQDTLDSPNEYAAVNIDEKGCIEIDDGIRPGEPVATADLQKVTKDFVDDIPKMGFVRANKRYQSAVMELYAAAAIPGSDADNAHNIKALRMAQDDILVALKEMQDVAQDCVSKSDTCLFNQHKYRSPYAYRLQLLPKLGYAQNSRDLIELFVEDVSKTRCKLNPENAGCISNSRADGWHEKIGLLPVVKAQQPELHAHLSTLLDNKEYRERHTCSRNIEGSPALSVEKKHNVIWADLSRLPARTLSAEQSK
ncbi:MAG: hypothetical protein AAF465_02190 [Pseudomonadota bacterium]